VAAEPDRASKPLPPAGEPARRNRSRGERIPSQWAVAVEYAAGFVAAAWLYGLAGGVLAVLVAWLTRQWFPRWPRYRRHPEILWLLTTVGLYLTLAVQVGSALAVVATVLVVAAVAGHPDTRRRLLEHRQLTRLRWDWHCGCARAGLYVAEQRTHPQRGRGRVTTRERREPDVMTATTTNVGLALRVRLHSGLTAGDLERAGDRLAAWYRARQVTVTPDRGDASRATVTVHYRDPLETGTIAWPRPPGTWSLWDPVPVGVDAHGNWQRVELVGHHLLIGGESGSGKSVAVSALLAYASLDPNTRLHLIDGKQVDLADFEPVADTVAGPSVTDAVGVLHQVQAVMEHRYRTELPALHARKLTRAHGLSLHLVICDELAFYTEAPNRNQRDTFNAALRDLVQRGRAAGVVVVCATQKPEGRTVPTSIRDLFGYRLALRCNTSQASDTILGAGAASRGHDASTIPAAQRGVGFLHTEGTVPVRVRTAFLTDAQVREIARHAAELRGGPKLPGPALPPVASASSGPMGPAAEIPRQTAGNGGGPMGSGGGPVGPGPAFVKHGHTARGKRSPTYNSWRKMRDRCLNPRSDQYADWGGRGITVCDRWAEFSNFLEDMGERPAGHTLDRIDVDGDYEPGNCRWATAAEQRANQRRGG
jgi:FtsK/SpoIIIE family